MKNVTSLRIFVVGSLAVIALWCLYAFFNYGHSLEQAGQFGDKFGALNTLFTGLASVGVVAALWHEREGAKDREREHDDLIAATKIQIAVSAHAARITAIMARIEGYHKQESECGPYDASAIFKLRGERDRLLRMLDEAYQNPPKF